MPHKSKPDPHRRAVTFGECFLIQAGKEIHARGSASSLH